MILDEIVIFRPVRILNERFYGNEPLVRYHKQPIKMSHGGMPSRSFIMSGGLSKFKHLLHKFEHCTCS
jgi:hypothetical protein